MINGINSIVNFTELTEKKDEEIKVAIPPVMYKELSPVEYTNPRYLRVVKSFDRRKVGIYPKGFAIISERVIRFCFSFTHYRVEFVNRGRGSRVQAAKADKLYARAYDQDLPLRHAKKVAVYMSIIRRVK